MQTVETCPVCELEGIAGKRGLTAHMRLKHPVQYPEWHAAQNVRKPSKAAQKKAAKKKAKKAGRRRRKSDAPTTEEAPRNATEEDFQAEVQAEQQDPEVPADGQPLIILDTEELFDLYLG